MVVIKHQHRPEELVLGDLGRLRWIHDHVKRQSVASRFLRAHIIEGGYSTRIQGDNLPIVAVINTVTLTFSYNMWYGGI